VVANTTLSGYYAAMSRAVDALAKKWQASDKQYKPQAYPQISQALREISRAVAGTDIDKPLGRGYALVTDIVPAKALVVALVGGALAGTVAGAISYYWYQRPAPRAVACGLWVGVNTFFGIATWGLGPVASPAWGTYWTIRGIVGGGAIC
jgi:hypothetical protein